jgi:phenylalanyl-tRNA synthetase beta chain
MKVPLNWLRDYVDINLPEAELVERLTLAGLEVAGVRVLGLPMPPGLRVKEEDRGPVWARDKIVTAKILKIDRHPDADRLKLPTVEYGSGLVKTLVTGAPNVKVGQSGQKIILALQGAELFDGHSEVKRLTTLKPIKMRGVPSDAMACSYLELGISEEHEGIVLLEGDAPVGVPLADFMGDVVIDIDVLPNMSRCLSMIGVAREVAAITSQKLKLPPRLMQTSGEPIDGQVHVEIEDSALCARYAAVLLKNVSITPAPGWMQRRLMYAGMRPINNIVDITNFVMLEWGQPLHAFDYDKLVERASQSRDRKGASTPTITVRRARPGETLLTLDGQKRNLTPEMLVIADSAGPIALAGVMGGAETEVTAASKTILLESANFHFLSIRRTMKALNLPSEASTRFSKGIHPEIVRPTAERAAELMRQFAGATICRGIADNYPAPLPPQVIDFPLTSISRLLGTQLAPLEVVSVLQALEYKVEVVGDNRLCVTVPPHRIDIQDGVSDLIEDITRIHGYDRLPATLMTDSLPRQRTNTPLVFEERVRDILVGLGMQEVITYSLTMPEREAPLGLPAADYVRLANPISSERVIMRHSVLAGVLEVAAANLRNTEDVRLFELGPVYLPRPGQPLPDEPRRLALVMTGRQRSEFWADTASGATANPQLDFYDLKGIVEALVNDLHLPEVRHHPSTIPYLHPGQAAELHAGEKLIGHFGRLHPKVAEAIGLGQRAILAGELDVEALQSVLPARFAYTPVPRFPPALRDIALILPEEMTAERVLQEISAAGGNLLRGARLFDVYRGESIPKGTKSFAYALTYQADDRTLTDKEADKAHKKIEDRLKHVLKAQIRGQ